MKIYNVTKGTKGKLITNEYNEDAPIKDWIVRKPMSFEEVEVLVNPEDWITIPCPYPQDSLALKMLSKGYVIFSNSAGIDPKHMLAVQYSDVEITDEYYEVVEPTPEEHAYHVGWTAHLTMKEQNLENMVNPYDPIDQTKLNEKWSDGFKSATISDNI